MRTLCCFWTVVVATVLLLQVTDVMSFALRRAGARAAFSMAPRIVGRGQSSIATTTTMRWMSTQDAPTEKTEEEKEEEKKEDDAVARLPAPRKSQQDTSYTDLSLKKSL